jgi:hypothetical protein
MRRSPVRIRCQHAELSGVRRDSPTHTSAGSHRIFFLKTKIYAGDKENFSRVCRSRTTNSKRSPRRLLLKRFITADPTLPTREEAFRKKTEDR